MAKQHVNRRNFIGTISLGMMGASALILPRYGNAMPFAQQEKNINHIGPTEGYTPHIGTLITMLDWLSNTVIQYNNKLTTAQLDYVHDEDSNSIGSLMMHVAATEVIYQDITFKNRNDFTPENKPKWNIAMELGKPAQEKIKGNPLSYYKDMILEVRKDTKAEMKTRDDAWLLSGETKEWNWNNYCKWFHVAEHFANHRGQMTWYAKRVPNV